MTATHLQTLITKPSGHQNLKKKVVENQNRDSPSHFESLNYISVSNKRIVTFDTIERAKGM